MSVENNVTQDNHNYNNNNNNFLFFFVIWRALNNRKWQTNAIIYVGIYNLKYIIIKAPLRVEICGVEAVFSLFFIIIF